MRGLFRYQLVPSSRFRWACSVSTRAIIFITSSFIIGVQRPILGNCLIMGHGMDRIPGPNLGKFHIEIRTPCNLHGMQWRWCLHVLLLLFNRQGNQVIQFTFEDGNRSNFLGIFLFTSFLDPIPHLLIYGGVCFSCAPDNLENSDMYVKVLLQLPDFVSFIRYFNEVWDFNPVTHEFSIIHIEDTVFRYLNWTTCFPFIRLHETFTGRFILSLFSKTWLLPLEDFLLI
jgi:hypothetical protein